MALTLEERVLALEQKNEDDYWMADNSVWRDLDNLRWVEGNYYSVVDGVWTYNDSWVEHVVVIVNDDLHAAVVEMQGIVG